MSEANEQSADPASPGASLVKQRCWIDPDFLKRSLTKRLVQRHGDQKLRSQQFESRDPRVCKQAVISFGVLFVLKCSSLLHCLTFAR